MKKVDSLLPGPVGLSAWSHCLKWELSAQHLADVCNVTVGEPNP